MSPMLASILEQMENEPGRLDGITISYGASMATSHIRRLEATVTQMREDFRRIQMLAEQHCPADASVKHQ